MASFIVRSCGLFSSWAYCQDFHILFDCGEGCATDLARRVESVKHVFLTHGHTDHIAGLPTFLRIRERGTSAPVNIYYPSGDAGIIAMRHYLESGKPLANINWIEIPKNPEKTGFCVPITNIHNMLAFKTEHIQGAARNHSCGFVFCETRNKLKEEYRGLSFNELQKIECEAEERGTPVSLSEKISVNRFVYTGDCLPCKPTLEGGIKSPIYGCEYLFHDATFESRGELEGARHSTYAEAGEVGKIFKVPNVIGLHASPRLLREWPRHEKAAKEAGVTLLHPSKLHKIDLKI
jgi:ribonuclease Z